MASAAQHAALAALVALLLAVEADAADGYGIAGPFRFVVERTGMCPPGRTDVPFSMAIKLVRDRFKTSLFWISTNITLSEPFDDNLSGTADFDSWNSHGGWKTNAYHFAVPRFCSTLRTGAPQMWRTVLKNMHIDPDHTCPFPAGNYVANNISTKVDEHLRLVPVFFYGKYRVTSYLLGTQTRKRVACSESIVSVVPKYVKER